MRAAAAVLHADRNARIERDRLTNFRITPYVYVYNKTRTRYIAASGEDKEGLSGKEGVVLTKLNNAGLLVGQCGTDSWFLNAQYTRSETNV